jgi:D-serine deaminase-like pyridoxal phosphate-dependent protein
VCKLNAAGARMILITDEAAIASTIAEQPAALRTLIEIDSGEERGGISPDGDLLPEIAARLGSALAGVMTHAGHSYFGRTVAEMARIAEAEPSAVTRAAVRLRQAGHDIDIVWLATPLPRAMRRA